MAYFPYAPQKGAPYTITGPNGVVAAFNDPTDPNYVGMISEITGLDSADVRESGEDLVQADGGQHGDFYFGRRPIVITAQVFGHATQLERELKIDKIIRSTVAMREDAVLSWTNQPTDSFLPMQTWVRRQQPVRVTGGWNKEVNIPLVSQFAPLFGQTVRSTSGAVVENRGSYPAFPVVRVNGPAVNPTISVTGAGTGTLYTTGLTINSGQWVEFDMLNETAVWHDGTSANQYINFGTTQVFPRLETGNNTVASSAGTITTYWRDTWI